MEVTDPRQQRRSAFRNQARQIQGRIGRINYCFNPLTSIAAATITWVIVILALAIPKDENILDDVISWFTRTCTWFYTSTFTITVFFVIFIYVKFGHLKLGVENDKPEFNDFSYFALVFTAGTSSALFYLSVSDPINHYNDINDGLIFWGKGNKNTLAQNAINITFLHWAFHGYSIYVVPSILIGILGYRKGLPLTMRTCFYPIFGRRIFGIFGDMVDTISILCVIFGVSVSLTFGSKLLNAGINEISEGDRFTVERENQIICIWVLTAVATLSVLSGLHLGMKRLACYSFVAGVFFLLVIMFCDDMWYTLNTFVQSFGYYIQHFIGSGTHTAAFGQTGKVPKQTAPKKWMEKNTINYWGWWAGWGPLGNIFITRVSKGRTIRSLINYNFILPSLFVCMVITILGSSAINLENEALGHGITCDMYANNIRNNSYNWNGIDDKIVRLSCLNPGSQKYYEILKQIDDIKYPMHILSLISIILWFSTSSDSASFVVDILSTNGIEHPSKEQRAFWALTEGAAATALAYFPEDYTYIFVVMFGLPYTAFLWLCFLSLWRLLKKEPNWQYDLDGMWQMDYGNIKSIYLLKKVAKSTFLPWLYLAEIAIYVRKIDRRWKQYVVFFLFSLLFYSCISLLILQIWSHNVGNMGWGLLIGFFVYISYFRMQIRNRQGIEGNVVEDLLASIFFPLTITQMHGEMVYMNRLENHNEHGYVNKHVNDYVSDGEVLETQERSEEVEV